MIMKLMLILSVILYMVSGNNNLCSAQEAKSEPAITEPAQPLEDKSESETIGSKPAVEDKSKAEHRVKLTQDQLKQLDYYKKQAFNALKKGEYPYCAAMFEKYIAVKNDDFKVNEYLSQVYIFMKKYPEAAQILKKLTELNPKYAAGYVNLGRLYRELGLFDESVASLKKALELRNNVETLFQLGLTYERFNKPDKARSIYEEVIYVLPVHAEAHFSLGLLYLREKNYDKAKREISRAVELNPNRTIYQTYLNKVDKYKESDNKTPQVKDKMIVPDNS